MRVRYCYLQLLFVAIQIMFYLYAAYGRLSIRDVHRACYIPKAPFLKNGRTNQIERSPESAGSHIVCFFTFFIQMLFPADAILICSLLCRCTSLVFNKPHHFMINEIITFFRRLYNIVFKNIKLRRIRP